MNTDEFFISTQIQRTAAQQRAFDKNSQFYGSTCNGCGVAGHWINECPTYWNKENESANANHLSGIGGATIDLGNVEEVVGKEDIILDNVEEVVRKEDIVPLHLPTQVCSSGSEDDDSEWEFEDDLPIRQRYSSGSQERPIVSNHSPCFCF